MDYSEQRTESLDEHRSMVLDAARLSGGTRAHDASADAAIIYPTAPVCGRCGRRNLRIDEIINQWTYCCKAPVVQG